jgi:paraquat-inducible protein B
MSRKASPAWIGAFVVGALGLGIVAVLLFGSGRLFRSASTFVLFFPGSVDGLAVGAPVRFKGVEIGAVTDIRIALGDPERGSAGFARDVRVPVFVEIDDEKLSSLGAPADLDDPGTLRELVRAGLRGQLATQSLVTGLLFVQLDFHPDTPASLYEPDGSLPPEIPAIPTRIEQVQNAAAQVIQKLQSIDFDRVLQAMVDTLEGIDRLVNSAGLHEGVAALPKAVASLEGAAAELRDFVDHFDRRSEPVFRELERTTTAGREALEQARDTLARLEKTVGPTSPLAVSVQRSLQDVSEAARAVHLLADYLERNPSALVRGREIEE